ESIPRRDENPGRPADLGVRRFDGMDARSSSHQRRTRADDGRSEAQPSARCHPAAYRRGGRIAPGPDAAGRPQRSRSKHAHARALDEYDEPDRAVDRRPDAARHERGVCRGRWRPGPGGGIVLGLPGRRRRADAIPGGAARRPHYGQAPRARHAAQPPDRAVPVQTSILTLRVFLSCGEASGDLYAGALVREMRALVPDLDVFGVGGREFTKAGGRVIADFQEVSTSGLTEPLARLPQLLAVKRRLIAAADA